MTKTQERVQRGIAFLDRNAPGWRDKIDLATLDLVNCKRCVIGQIFGEYVKGVNVILGEAGRELREQFVSDHAFALEDTYAIHPDKSWRNLTNAWIEALEQLSLPN